MKMSFMRPEDVDYAVEGLRMRGEMILRTYRRGMITDRELFDGFYELFHTVFHETIYNHNLRLRITEDSWPRFLAEREMWKRGEAPEGEGEYWLRWYTPGDRMLPGEDGTLRWGDAGADDKAQVFRLMEALDIPDAYFTPEPAANVGPDMRWRPGGTYVITFPLADDDGLAADPSPGGKSFTLVNTQGLKARVRIVEKPLDDDRWHNRIGDLLAMGTIEGYTSDREREIEIDRKGYDEHSMFLVTLRESDDVDATHALPLWQAHFAFTDEQWEREQAVVRALIERLQDEIK